MKKPKEVGYVATVKGRIIGFADTGPARDKSLGKCEIDAIYVLESFKRQGVGIYEFSEF